MRLFIWSTAVLALAVVALAMHGTARATSCSVTGSVAFGNFDVFAGASTFTGSISGSCAGGNVNVAWVRFGNGNNYNSTSGNRQMACTTCTGAFASDKLEYQLYTNSTRTTLWSGTATSASFPINGVHNASWGPVSVYGEIFASVAGGMNDSAVGSYSDTVVATISY